MMRLVLLLALGAFAYPATLQAQFQLMGVVRGGDQIIADVDISLYNALSGSLLAQTTTDNLGAYQFTVAADSYDLFLEPPDDSGFQSTWVRGVQVDADLIRDIVLLPTSINWSGRVVDPDGIGITKIGKLCAQEDHFPAAGFRAIERRLGAFISDFT